MLDLRVGGVHPDIMVLLPIAGRHRRRTGPGGDHGLRRRPGGRPLPAHALRALGAGGMPRRLRGRGGHPGPRPHRLVAGPAGRARGQRGLRGHLRRRSARSSASPRCSTSICSGWCVVVSVTNAVLALPALRLVTWGLPAASTEGMPTSTWPPAVSGERRLGTGPVTCHQVRPRRVPSGSRAWDTGVP